MYITREILEKLIRNGWSSRTNPKPPKVSQPLKKDKELVSLNSPKVKQREEEKLYFSKESF